MKQINNEQIKATWKDVVLEATELDYGNPLEKKRVDWICEYAHFHDTAINENATLGNVPDIGNPNFPGFSGGEFTSSQKGSGDQPDTSLSIALQVARQTVGFDLVPVVPMDNAYTMLTYFDTVYAGGRMDTNTPPVIVEVRETVPEGGTSLFDGLKEADNFEVFDNDGDAKLADFKFIGFSRINNRPIVQVVKLQADSLAMVSQKNIKDETTATNTVQFSFELVNAFENHITGFSGESFDNDAPYSREGGMNNKMKTLGLQMYSKAVRAGTYQVDAAIKWEQLQDMPRAGLNNPYEMAQTAVMNELTQSINKYILYVIDELAQEHVNVNPRLSTLTLTEMGSSFSARDIGHEKRKIYSRMLSVSNMIANKGARGPADTAVVNISVASILQDVSNFNAYSGTNTLSQDSGDLYQIGSVGRLNVFVDPTMTEEQNDVYVFRRGDGQSPGVVFMPYILAEGVSVVPEGTLGYKVAMKSRFAVVKAGHNPHVFYYKFSVENVIDYL